MFRLSLRNRLKKLESRLSQGPNRVLLFNPNEPNSRAEALSKCGQGKFLLVSSYGSSEDWEASLRIQQDKLISDALPHTLIE